MSAMAHAAHRRPADPVEAFKLRCWARARLYADGELDLLDAVDALQAFAERLGLIETLGQDVVQAMMAEAFAPVRAAEFQSYTNCPDVTLKSEAADRGDNITPIADDDYAGLTHSLAAACRRPTRRSASGPSLTTFRRGRRAQPACNANTSAR
jgi:hypothetical protein